MSYCMLIIPLDDEHAEPQVSHICCGRRVAFHTQVEAAVIAALAIEWGNQGGDGKAVEVGTEIFGEDWLVNLNFMGELPSGYD